MLPTFVTQTWHWQSTARAARWRRPCLQVLTWFHVLISTAIDCDFETGFAYVCHTDLALAEYGAGRSVEAVVHWAELARTVRDAVSRDIPLLQVTAALCVRLAELELLLCCALALRQTTCSQDGPGVPAVSLHSPRTSSLRARLSSQR